MKTKVKNMGMQKLDSRKMEVIVGGCCSTTAIVLGGVAAVGSCFCGPFVGFCGTIRYLSYLEGC